MTEKVIMEILNTSLTVGIGIAVSGLLLSLGVNRYSAKCRKIVWIFAACSLLIPFGAIGFPRAYTAEIPVDVLMELNVEEKDHGKKDGGAEIYTVNFSNADGTDYSEDSIEIDPATLKIKPQGPMHEEKLLQTEKKAEITIGNILFGIWLSGCGFLTVLYAAGYWRMLRKIRRWGNVCEDEAARRILLEVTAELQMKKVPELRSLPDASMGPYTTGLLRNVIVLPDEALQEKDLKFILKHEAIHCKNKDILWKLFFLGVNMIHWFNPLVWLLRRLAEQDMEIICDEEVVREASKAEKIEYGDVIMSCVQRSRFKRSAISTGYVREVKFLKRRFENIFHGESKKNGILLAGSACAMILFADCAFRVENGGTVYSTKNAVFDQEAENGKVPVDDGANLQKTGDNLVTMSEWDEEDLSGNRNADIVGVKSDYGTNSDVAIILMEKEPENSMPDEIREIEDIVEEFASAYFNGDKERMQKFLVSSYEGDLEVYGSTGTIDDITIKGLPETVRQEPGSILEISLEFRDHNFYADTFRYLTLEMVRQNDAWKIQFYGLEG